MRRALNVFLFLQLTYEPEGMWFGRMWTPLRLVSFLLDKPFRISIFQGFIIISLFLGGRAAKTGRARPMDQTLVAAIATIGVFWCYGVATGGLVKATLTQIFTMLTALLFGLSLSRFNRTSSDFFELGKVVFYAAVYRSCVVAIFYFGVVRGGTEEIVPFMSAHEDSVLFVDGLLLAIVYALEIRTKKAVRTLLLSAPIIFLAIQLNNRRIAWASLIGGLLVAYALLPSKGKFTRRFHRALFVVAPVIALYVMVGWGRSEKIFKPLASFASMGGGKIDPSTKARDNENMGLVTMVGERPALGTGWGHEWLELDATYTVPVSVFPMYHFLCHNTVLIILAFSGFAGFAGLWMVFPVSAFLNARTYRFSRDPLERVAAMSGVCGVVVTINQMWGDMGLIGVTPTYLVAVGYAVAARLSVTSGAWPQPGAARPRVEAPVAELPQGDQDHAKSAADVDPVDDPRDPHAGRQ